MSNSNQGSNNKVKYRPYLTETQIEVILIALDEKDSRWQTQEEESNAIAVQQTLRLLQAKIAIGATSGAYIPTGNRPGPASIGERLLVPDIPVRVSYEEAVIQAKYYSELGAPVPTHIQSILDSGNCGKEN